MKDNKTILLLIVSILLIIVSMFLLYTWIYKIEPMVQNVNQQSKEANYSTRNVNDKTLDSLQFLYASVLSNINKSIDSISQHSDSLQTGMNTKIAEFYSLKNEINDLLASDPTDKSIFLAKQKIIELQLSISQLKIANSSIEKENARLNKLIKQLSIPEQNTTDSKFEIVNTVADNPKKNTESIKIDASTFDLKLSAFVELDGQGEKETQVAQQTTKLTGSFVVKNTSPEQKVLEMVVIVQQPDGKVLQKSSWETGSFETKEGRKIYSYKTRADFNEGESKRILFTLDNENYQKGNYIMQVYYNGILLGKTTKYLS